MSSNAKPTALILLNMGGPDSLDAVEPFLYNLFSDRELIQLPAGALLQKPFAKMISHFRAKKVVENYRTIGGKSPLLEWTRKQAEGIASRLDNVKPYVIMRYWHPFADDVLREIKQEGIEKAVVLSMYPHYTGATTGSSINDFRRAVGNVYPELEYHLIEEWYNWPPYLDSLANRVKEGIELFHDLLQNEVQILFSAHALPQKFIDRGDPYQTHVEVTAHEVMKRVGDHFGWRIAYQSRSGPVRWMTPGTEDVIKWLAMDDHRCLLMVPISFVSDHIETLEEIDIEYRELAAEAGFHHFHRAPSLNDNADFLNAMAALVKDRGGL
ncbi:ferrochelatase [Malonomonas rubra DSM 5091]|uniref:Ferrochelatase n=1 Tax=Malonomonas rubra DSM 5091 TaxID=1122189 RepID=A0A1M6ICC0_MALRU|nr:ferrochelatase [Malonomonas rubra]SHJ32057.1 ferrochelatase [Malonomonas rubra DSM 5091]